MDFIDCSETSNTLKAHIPRTNEYYVHGGHIGAGSSAIDPQMGSAISLGVYAPPIRLSGLVDVECRTGTCGFDPFLTVGVCSQCQDISNQMIVTENDSNNMNLRTFTISVNDSSDGLMSLWAASANLAAFPVFQTLASKDLGSTRISRLLAVKSDAVVTETHESGVTGTPAAFDCQLYACLREYHSTMTNNTLNEALVSQTPLPMSPEWPGSISAYYFLKSNETIRNGRWENCTGDDEGLSSYPEDCFWAFGFFPGGAIIRELDKQLGNLTVAVLQGSAMGSVPALRLWRNGTATIESMNDFVSDLADIMTAIIRNTGTEGNSSTYAQGVVTVDATCIRVRWKWFSFLCTLVGLGCLFFLLALRAFSQAPKDRLWKSSTLPVLFCFLDQNMHQATGVEKEKNEMFDFAKRINVLLQEDDDGKARFFQK